MVSGESLVELSLVKGAMSVLLGKYEKWMRGNYLWTGGKSVEKGVEKMLVGWVRSLQIRLGFRCLSY